VVLPTGEVAGGEIRCFQLGCDMPDESSPWFSSVEEAEAAGCDLSDVSWQASGIFDYDLTAFDYYDMEWSGY
jgi:hypothetical protein